MAGLINSSKKVTFAPQNDIATFNKDSVPCHVYRNASSSITSSKEWSCTQFIKNIFSRLYDFLARWICCLSPRKKAEKREKPITKADVAESTKKFQENFNRRVKTKMELIKKDPSYQSNPQKYLDAMQSRLPKSDNSFNDVDWCVHHDLSRQLLAGKSKKT